jgi:hypothetical protein
MDSCTDRTIRDCSLFESTRDRTNLASRFDDNEQEENFPHGPVRKRLLRRARVDEQDEHFPFETAKNVPRGPVRKRILIRAHCDVQEESFPFGPPHKHLHCDLSGKDEKSPSLLGFGNAKEPLLPLTHTQTPPTS